MKLSWLKAAGRGIVKGAKIAGQVAGVVENNAQMLKLVLPDAGDRIVDRALSEIDTIQNVVVDVETLGVLYGWSGPEKLEEASKRVASLVINGLVLARKPVIKPELLKDASVRLTQAVVDILNSFEVEAEAVPDATGHHV